MLSLDSRRVSLLPQTGCVGFVTTPLVYQAGDFSRAETELLRPHRCVAEIRRAFRWHLLTTMHLNRTADRRAQLPPAPSSGTTMLFNRNCGSAMTSCGPRTAPNVT